MMTDNLGNIKNNILAVIQQPNSSTQNMNLVITIIIAIIIVLVGITIFSNKK